MFGKSCQVSYLLKYSTKVMIEGHKGVMKKEVVHIFLAIPTKYALLASKNSLDFLNGVRALVK